MRLAITLLKYAAAALALLFLVGCAGGSPDKALYRQLGGEQGVDRLVTALLDEVYAGGPCTYQGLDMRAAHSGLDIRHDEFDAFVEDLIIAMERSGIATPAQNRLLAIFAPMREKVVFQ